MSYALPRPRANHPFLRRSADMLQVGLDRGTAGILTGVSDVVMHALVRLDGSIPRGQLTATLPELAESLDTLERLGLIEDSQRASTSLSHLRRQRLLNEHQVLAAAHGSHDAADEILARRSGSVVGIRGSDRVAALTAVGLACAGIGTVALLGPDHPVAICEMTPAGPFEPEIGWVEQLSEAVRRQGSHASLGRNQILDLVVISHAADVQIPWTDPELAHDLLAEDIAHYPVAVSGAMGRVGPLIIPGITPCLECLNLRETDRDRAWPALIDQIRLRHHRSRAQDATVAGLCAAVAVGEILEYLDQGAELWAARESHSYMEFRASDPAPAVVPVAPHPLCGCGWDHLPHTMES